jgi:hypothetical protein
MPRGADPAAIRQSLLTEALHNLLVDDCKGERPQTSMQQNSLFSIFPATVSPPICVICHCVICIMASTFSAFELAANPAALNSNVSIEGDEWLSRERGG